MCIKNALWIAWERHRRTIEISDYLKINRCLYNCNYHRVYKYPYLIVKTIHSLTKYRPKILIIQNPSIVLAFIATILKNLYKYKIIIDAHNAAIRPENKFLKKLNKFFVYVQKKADITIVTNRNLSLLVKKNGGKPFILTDKIPSFLSCRRSNIKDKKILIVCICTFNEDEPFIDMLESSKLLKENYLMKFTGNYNKIKDKNIIRKYSKVEFTGFLDDNAYLELLNTSDIIIDLTKREDCLVCGAYEAVAFEKPIILSDTEILRKTFHRGAVFTKNDPVSLAYSIEFAYKNIDKLKEELKKLKYLYEKEWEEKIGVLIEEINKA